MPAVKASRSEVSLLGSAFVQNGVGVEMSGFIERLEWRRLRRQVERWARDADEAEDCLQAAYLRMSERADSGAGGVTQLQGYLLHAARNIAIDGHRHRKLQDRRFADLAAGTPETAPLQDEVLMIRLRLERVSEGLDRLPARTRAIFLRHRIDEARYRQIAEEFGISVSAVEKHIAKAALFLTNWAEHW